MRTQLIQILKKYDFSFFGLMSLIFFIGVVNLYSATNSTAFGGSKGLYSSQALLFMFAFCVGVVVSLIHPKNLYRFSYFIYFINLVLLVLVLFWGTKSLGAQRWLVLGPFRLQPSEPMKISVVLALSRWLYRNRPEDEIGMKELIVPFLIAFVPALLIIVEPDLGTGLVILLIFAMMIFYCRLKWATLLVLLLVGALSGVVVYNFGLKTYQKKRIHTFLNPQEDALGHGYNAIQSEIAIGSGQIFGKGFKKSTQASLRYLPENHTDFVFSIYNEEHGFVGALFLVGLFVVFLLRYVWLAQSVLQFYDSIVVIGLMSIIFWHTFINMGMVTGLMPIVGLPLPLLSYGGSSLLSIGICCGMATSISNGRNIF